MADDEILRPTIIKSLYVRGLSHELEPENGSFKTYDLNGKARFQFKHEGITISGPYTALTSGHIVPRVTRKEFEQSNDGRLPEVFGTWLPRIRALVFEEFYVKHPRQGKRIKDNDQ